MRTILNLYQIATTDSRYIADSIKKNANLRIVELLTQALKDLESMEQLGLAGWQVRWIINKLQNFSIGHRNSIRHCHNIFEKKYWPHVLENYHSGPVTDLFYGLSASVFALNAEKDHVRNVSNFILNRMKKEIVNVDGLWGWLTVESDKNFPVASTIDFGMAHGITNGLLALSHLVRVNPSAEDSIYTILGKLYSSFQIIFNTGRIENLRPALINKSHSASNHRLGWCRSDLSTGLALIITGRRVGQKKLTLLGLRFLGRLKNQSKKILMTDNPYLCHGSSGNFYLFWLAYELTQDRWFLDQARSADSMTGRFIQTDRFPRKPQIMEIQLSDLRNCILPARSFHHKLSREWDFIFGYRDLCGA